MTAPQHTAKPTVEKKDSGPSKPCQLQRSWFVGVGWLGSFGFVVSQMGLAVAYAESDFSLTDYAVDAGAVAANVDLPAANNLISLPAPAAYVPPAPVAAPVAAPAPAVQAPAVRVEASPALAPAVSPVAPPTFSAVQKSRPTKTAARHAGPLAGLIEASAVAAPLSTYVNGPIAQASGLEEAPPSVDAAEVPDISPAIAAPEPAPAPPVNIAPSAETSAPVQATELVPEALPESAGLPENLPEEYNSVFVDPTDYSVGATAGPEVVVSEQSTGCEFTVGANRAVPNGACAAPTASSESAQIPATSAPAQSAPVASAPAQSAPVASAPAVNVGPVSFSATGIRFSGSTTAAGRDYLNRSVRPMVNLQAAQQFIFPLAIPSPITSLFGFRIHPITGDHRFHAGTDIGAAQGTPVLAAQEGTVASADYAGGYGLMVAIEHEIEGTRLQSRYAHLSEILVEPGRVVKKGDVVGLVGSTGNSTGPHLHFEMLQASADGWVHVNPDGLVQNSLASLVQALNNPMQALNFSLADLQLKRGSVGSASTSPAASSEESLTGATGPGQNGIPFRPAQPNAS
ncbi:MAG: peptidoglycan DD-metalloendopeptidase family protein [Phormidesmis sp.]